MNIPDIINAAFESAAAFFVVLSIRRLRLDKDVKGFSIIAVMFFTFWGYWNLIFYPTVGAWMSFYGGVLVTLANTVYLGLYFYLKQTRH